jgi:hypothetical protein
MHMKRWERSPACGGEMTTSGRVSLVPSDESFQCHCWRGRLPEFSNGVLLDSSSVGWRGGLSRYGNSFEGETEQFDVDFYPRNGESGQLSGGKRTGSGDVLSLAASQFLACIARRSDARIANCSLSIQISGCRQPGQPRDRPRSASRGHIGPPPCSGSCASEEGRNVRKMPFVRGSCGMHDPMTMMAARRVRHWSVMNREVGSRGCESVFRDLVCSMHALNQQGCGSHSFQLIPSRTR